MAKTANVMARIEPEVKEQAEAILGTLGVPVSVAINMFYKQIILTRGIPFELALPPAPKSRGEMTEEEFHEMMAQGMEDIEAGRSLPLKETFARLRKELGLDG